ncbi:hypothetical protein D0U02_35920 [Burkholderia pseudomallei]|nr:hypothetical protein D0U05_33230 [Burkholderia pseudomallei]RFS51451.1 hypothetical protein D0U02_35920 [Burkholderia pseudomallei]RFS54058.1 hypothetical protein D0U01_33390 [Burkholderia pseudomallei]RFS67332.1 hypothetical protein D0T98_33460 [Burkholderia pseudomallei]
MRAVECEYATHVVASSSDWSTNQYTNHRSAAPTLTANIVRPSIVARSINLADPRQHRTREDRVDQRVACRA